MSWISENYEKALVAGALVTALGFGFLGLQSISGTEVDFAASPKGRGPEDASVKNADQVSTAISSLTRPRSWTNAEDDGRPVDLFTGVPLFVNKNDPDNPVDLQKSSEVHAGIPNQWWIDNRIDPGYGDSPARDEDGDGFSNREEFVAKTDPTDAAAYPSLVGKLKYVGDEAIEWYVRPGFDAGDGAFTFEYRDTKGVNEKANALNPVLKGDTFFKTPKDARVKERFRYLGYEKKTQRDERIQTDVEVTIVKIEDLKANKKTMVYEIPAFFRQADYKKFTYFDRTAILSLNALGMSGQQIRVEEFTEFTLPPGGNGQKFKVMKVSPEQVTIVEVLGDGQTKEHQIIKGTTGNP